MMGSMDWATVGTMVGFMAAGFGYLTRQLHRTEDRLQRQITDVVARLERLDERYIRHLEQHATGG